MQVLHKIFVRLRRAVNIRRGEKMQIICNMRVN